LTATRSGGTDRQAGGSGLGLYIVRGYVTAMGGEVWVEDGPTGGSVFVVALPAAGDGSWGGVRL
jgi:signal transduction histidine kinase